MARKNDFIAEVEGMINSLGYKWKSKDAEDYFNILKENDVKKDTKKFTDKGKLILSFLKEHHTDYNNAMKAKVIAEGMGISSGTVSGAIRKLVTDGYVEKIAEDPSIYAITESGINVDLEN